MADQVKSPPAGQLTTVEFPLSVVECGEAVLVPGVAVECYHLTNGQGAYTADGNEISDTAVETVFCKLVDPPGEFMYFELSYQLSTYGHCGGIESVSQPHIKIIRGAELSTFKRQMAERRLVELLAKDPNSMCSEIDFGAKLDGDKWVEQELICSPHQEDILAADPDEAELHLEQCLYVTQKELNSFAGTMSWGTWVKDNLVCEKSQGWTHRSQKPAPSRPAFFVCNWHDPHTIAPGVLRRDPARIYLAYEILAAATKDIKFPKSPYGIETVTYSGDNPLLGGLACVNVEDLANAAREMEDMLDDPNATTLCVRGMDIRCLPRQFFDDPRVITRLKHFDCSNNRLESVRVGGCTELRSLTCSNNRIYEVHFECSKLESLICDHNSMEELPYTLARCDNLQKIDCSENPDLVYPPPEIVAEGVESIKDWLREEYIDELSDDSQ